MSGILEELGENGETPIQIPSMKGSDRVIHIEVSPNTEGATVSEEDANSTDAMRRIAVLVNQSVRTSLAEIKTSFGLLSQAEIVGWVQESDILLEKPKDASTLVVKLGSQIMKEVKASFGGDEGLKRASLTSIDIALTTITANIIAPIRDLVHKKHC